MFEHMFEEMKQKEQKKGGEEETVDRGENWF